GDLGALDLGTDAEDLKLAADGIGVARHSDDAVVAPLQLPLGLERGVGYLPGDPAGLDTAQDAAGHRAVWRQGTDVGENLLRFGLHLVRQRLDVPGAAERVRDVGDLGFLHDH